MKHILYPEKPQESPSTLPAPTVAALTRRQSILAASALLGGGVFAASPYGELLKVLLGGSPRSLMDRFLQPSKGLRIGDGGEKHFVIHSLSVPDHATGQFPNEYLPYSILASPRVLRISKEPVANSMATPLRDWLFGIGMNGVFFDPSGPYWHSQDSGWQYENMAPIPRVYLSLDLSNGHVQPNGVYHYHGVPSGLLSTLDSKGMTLLGFAADGFPIYSARAHRVANDATSALVEMKSSYRLKSGNRPTGSAPGLLLDASGSRDYKHDGSFIEDHVYEEASGDLDECNGRVGVTPEYPQGTYYYCITNAFPYIPRKFRGTPDPSFFQAPAPAALGGPMGENLRKYFG